jgi:hypothetical protein
MENRPLFSAEITDIIGTPPRWIVRAGGGRLLGLLLGVAALASSIALPEHHSYPLVLKGEVAPYYLRQSANQLRPLLASGSVVTKGHYLTNASPTDTIGGLRAPFTGTYFSAAPTTVIPGDTLGLLVPLTNTYRFSGRIALGQLTALRQAPALVLEVPLEGTDQALVLHGHLSYIAPAVHNGQVTYIGLLDSSSNQLLAHRLVAITQLNGLLQVSGAPKTVVQRLLQTH